MSMSARVDRKAEVLHFCTTALHNFLSDLAIQHIPSYLSI